MKQANYVSIRRVTDWISASWGSKINKLYNVVVKYERHEVIPYKGYHGIDLHSLNVSISKEL